MQCHAISAQNDEYRQQLGATRSRILLADTLLPSHHDVHGAHPRDSDPDGLAQWAIVCGAAHSRKAISIISSYPLRR
jgi:hypothetical protein